MDSGKRKDNDEQFREFVKQFRAESLPEVITDIFNDYFYDPTINCTNEQFGNISLNQIEHQMVKNDNITTGMFLNY